MNLRISLLLTAACLTGCDKSIVCTLQPRAAVVATITDSISGAPLGYRSSIVLQTRRTYDSTFFGPDRFSGDTLRLSTVPSAYPMGGKFLVRVRRAGYKLWEQSDVTVDGDRCGATEAAMLVVRLQPAT
jgi:hypothetical protein